MISEYNLDQRNSQRQSLGNKAAVPKWILGPVRVRRRNLKTEQSPVISMDLCLRKTLAGKSRDYRDVIFLQMLRFKMRSRRF